MRPWIFSRNCLSGSSICHQVHRRHEAAIAEALEAAGLSLATWRMLRALRPMQPCTMNALARHTAVERIALTRALDQILKKGLALRTTPPEGRRQVLVTLTGPVLGVFEKARRIVTQSNRNALGSMPTERMKVLPETLSEYVRSMRPDEEIAADTVSFNHCSRAESENASQRLRRFAAGRGQH